MFNADFSMPAENPSHSREFDLGDLSHDTEAQQVAKGYLQYLKLLAVIKDVRSRSKLNQHVAIVSAGLVFNEAPEAPRTSRLDAVSATATLDFMRAHGLDDLAAISHGYRFPRERGVALIHRGDFCMSDVGFGSGVGSRRCVLEV